MTLSRLLAVGALTLGLGAPALAQLTAINNTGAAEVSTSYGAGSFLPPQTITTTFGPNGGVAVSDLDMRSFGWLRAAQTGYGLNAVMVDAHLQDMPRFTWNAATYYFLDVQNTGSLTIPSLDFQYHINGGRLELQDPNQLFRHMVASVTARIFADAPGYFDPIWEWGVSLRSDGFGNVSSLVDFFFDPFGMGMPALSPITIANGRAGMSIGALTGNANLGQLQSGDVAYLVYDMSAQVSGPGFGTGGLARLGDPFDANGDYGTGITLTAGPTVTATPEPATLWLVGAGLLLAGAMRRSMHHAARLHGPARNGVRAYLRVTPQPA